MRRIIVGALMGVALLASPLWARPEHSRGGWRQGDRYRSYGYGRGYGYGYPYRSWYVPPTYVVPDYPVAPEYRTGYQGDPDALVNAWYTRYLGREMDSSASVW